MIELIYFDSCALNRLTDDLSQPRILGEAESVAYALDELKAGRVQWLASTVLAFEISRNPNVRHRSETLALLTLATTTVAPEPGTMAAAARSSRKDSAGLTPCISRSHSSPARKPSSRSMIA